MTDTELNHLFFKWQMTELRASGRYYGGFARLPLFGHLLGVMREAAVQFLMACGHPEAVARGKAAHSTIVWASVHTRGSVHEPHMTQVCVVRHASSRDASDVTPSSPPCHTLLRVLRPPPNANANSASLAVRLPLRRTRSWAECTTWTCPLARPSSP
jgi:hypothetical protein